MKRSISAVCISYVCNLPSLKIVANEVPSDKKLYIIFYSGKKIAYETHFLFHVGDQDDLSYYVAQTCDFFINLSEDEVVDWAAPDEVMPALHFYRSLKEVRTRSGNLVWRKK
jgi:hypothetical protein